MAAFFSYLHSTCIKFSKFIISALTFYLQADYLDHWFSGSRSFFPITVSEMKDFKMYIYSIPIQIYYGTGEILIIYINTRRLAIDK